MRLRELEQLKDVGCEVHIVWLTVLDLREVQDESMKLETCRPLLSIVRLDWPLRQQVSPSKSHGVCSQMDKEL